MSTTTFVFEGAKQVDVPNWVTSLETFLVWAESEEFPEHGRICWLDGGVWIDTTMEQIFTHGQVKNEIAFTLTGLAKTHGLGIYFPDGALFVNEEAGLAVIPDGMFLSNESIGAGRVEFVEGADGGYTRILGTPDLVIEIVSTSSVKKDEIILRQSYWEAGIPEYWLIDARSEPIRYEILKHTARGYTSVRPKAGWLPSPTFGKSFRLIAKSAKGSTPQFAFEMK